jgi:hypothetical protein
MILLIQRIYNHNTQEGNAVIPYTEMQTSSITMTHLENQIDQHLGEGLKDSKNWFQRIILIFYFLMSDWERKVMTY